MTGDFLCRDAEIKIFIFFLMFIKLSSPIVISPAGQNYYSFSDGLVRLKMGRTIG